MDRMIQYRLEQLAKRLRSQVFAILLIAFWSILLVGLAVAFRQGVISSFGFLSGLILGGAGLLFLGSRFGYRDLNVLAERVERQYPDLDQKLLTAIQPAKPNESEFLRSKLIEEALSHAKRTEWDKAVSGSRLSVLWLLQWVLLLATVSVPLLMRGFSSGNRSSANAKPELLTDWQIEPGNAEMEKGTDLLVTVRFPDEFAEEIRLVAESADGQTQTVGLQRSLKDPIASTTLRRVKNPLRYRIESDTKNSDSFAVKIFEHPGVVQSDAFIQSPLYAGQEEKNVANTRRVSVVDGAQVTWNLKLNKDVASAEWIVEAGKSIQLTPTQEDATLYRIAESPTASTRYQLRLTDHQGRSEKVSEEFIVKVIPNREPALKLTSASDQRVSPIQEMLVGAKVQDDFGVHRAGISVSVGDSEPKEIELTGAGSEEAAIKKKELLHLIDLESWQAKADQLVTYHFWSEDLDRDGQPRRVDSEMFFAEIRPFEELFREGDASATQQRQQQQQQQQQGSQGAQQAEELAELQKKIISATWNLLRGVSNSKATNAQDLQDKVKVIEDSQQQAIEQSEKLKENLQSPESLEDLLKVQADMGQAVGELKSIDTNSVSVDLRDAIKPMRAAYEGLLRLRAREHEVTQNQQQQSQSQRSQSASQRNRQQQIEQLQLEQDMNRYEEESQPMQQETQAQQEMRQVMNRLDELARRQEDLNEQVRELDLALQAVNDEQEKKELQEKLDRLREEQQELVQDADELIERMNNPETRNELEESRQAIENARQQMQESQQQLSEAKPSAALNSGTRAQQDVEQTRERLREKSSEALQRDVLKLVEEAERVSQKQSQLERSLKEQAGITDKTSSESEKSQDANKEPRESLLRSESELNQQPSDQQQNLEAWKDQKNDYAELLERIKETVERAEGSEPLLAEQLYETYRDATRQPTQQRLERIPMMIQRGMDQPAVEESQEVSKDLQGLRDSIQKSTESVLGSEEESLRRALQELDRANRAIQEELSQRSAPEDLRDMQQRDTNQEPGQPQPGQPQPGQPQQGQPQQGQPQQGQPQQGQQQQGQQQQGQQQPGQPQPGQPPPGQPQQGQPQQGQPQQGQPQQGQAQPGQQQQAQQQQAQQQQGQPQQGQQQPGQPQPGQQHPGQPQPGQPQPGQPQPGQPQPGQPQPGQPQPGQPQPGQQQPGQQQPGQSTRDQIGQGRNVLEELRQRVARAQGSGRGELSAPLMGEDYARWTDQLRDIEELVRDTDLKAEAARVREAAREFRMEYKRHSKEPQWDLVKKMVSDPLKELQRKVQEELVRKTAKQNELVPLDRDPVPDKFRSGLDRYFERLGGEQSK